MTITYEKHFLVFLLRNNHRWQNKLMKQLQQIDKILVIQLKTEFFNMQIHKDDGSGSPSEEAAESDHVGPVCDWKNGFYSE